MKLRSILLFSIFSFALLAAGFFIFSPDHRDKTAQAIFNPASWQHTVVPGELSQAHAFLDNNCAACHASTQTAAAQNCIVCHANNEALLQRQPTAFHANIGECATCHVEHQGRNIRPVNMNHAALAEITERSLTRQTVSPSATKEGLEALAWLRSQLDKTQPTPNLPHATSAEGTLNCIICHGTKDKHLGFFGQNCASCHATDKWTLAEFKHPSANSQSCAQCHQAPPSHYMMHFQMVSMEKAGVKKAEVRQCFLCHQTTSWNDIKGIGFYKHH